MKPTEAAKIIGCSPQQVRTLIRQGKLRARRVKTDTDRNGKRLYVYHLTKDQVVRYAALPQTRGYPRGVPRQPKTKTNNGRRQP